MQPGLNGLFQEKPPPPPPGFPIQLDPPSSPSLSRLGPPRDSPPARIVINVFEALNLQIKKKNTINK